MLTLRSGSVTLVMPSVFGSYSYNVVASLGVPEPRVMLSNCMLWYFSRVTLPFGSVMVVVEPSVLAGSPWYAHVVVRPAGSVCDTTRPEAS